MRKQFEKKEEKKKEDPETKLPKLVISKFEGTALIGSGSGTNSRLSLINRIT